MRTFRFLHCADLHLDSPLRGLEADPDAPAETIRGATREALRNLVDHAISERIDFVIAAGDLYDGDWQDWRTGRFLIAQIKRLTDENIPFIAIRGNHDAESVITRRLRMPSDIAWLLDHRQPQTIRLPNLEVSIHGQSFATKAVTDNIARNYPLPDPDRFNIGLLHTSINGRDLHDDYAPCSIDDLRNHQYDYWALGHIHKHEIVSQDPWIVFPGNLQGRHINEEGPKGAILVTVAEGLIVSVVEVPLDTVRWTRISVTLSDETDEDAALTQIRNDLAAAAERAPRHLVAARITLSGACLAHEAFSRDLGGARERIRALALEVAEPGAIWIETIDILTQPPHASAARRDRSDAIGNLVRALETLPEEDIIAEVRLYAATMLGKSSPLRQALGIIDDIPDDLVKRARDLLLGSLTD